MSVHSVQESWYGRECLDWTDELFDGEYDSDAMRNAKRRALWESELGFRLPADRKDEESPAVDEEAIQALQEGRLPEIEADRIFKWTLIFRPWREAYHRVLMKRRNERLQKKLPPAG